jgi:hypothetical protein
MTNYAELSRGTDVTRNSNGVQRQCCVVLRASIRLQVVERQHVHAALGTQHWEGTVLRSTDARPLGGASASAASEFSAQSTTSVSELDGASLAIQRQRALERAQTSC